MRTLQPLLADTRGGTGFGARRQEMPPYQIDEGVILTEEDRHAPYERRCREEDLALNSELRTRCSDDTDDVDTSVHVRYINQNRSTTA